jgi:hypothetical protein
MTSLTETDHGAASREEGARPVRGIPRWRRGLRP